MMFSYVSNALKLKLLIKSCINIKHKANYYNITSFCIIIKTKISVSQSVMLLKV